MSAKRYVRSFTEAERAAIETGLKSKDIFILRRSQMLLLSSEGFSTTEIASKVGYHPDSVRQIIKKFDEKGLAVLKQGSRTPLTQTRSISSSNAEKMKGLLRHSPREFKKDSSLWTLELLAEVSYEQGLSTRKVSDETIRTILKELGVTWKRAKHWLRSSDPHYAHKKTSRTLD
jgi:transposase